MIGLPAFHFDMKLPKPEITFIVPIYGTRILVINNTQDYNIYLKHYCDPEPNTFGCDGMTFTTYVEDGQIILLGIFVKTIPILVHELSHCTFRILSHVGIPIEPNNSNEAFCYLIQYLYSQCEGVIK